MFRFDPPAHTSSVLSQSARGQIDVLTAYEQKEPLRLMVLMCAAQCCRLNEPSNTPRAFGGVSLQTGAPLTRWRPAERHRSARWELQPRQINKGGGA